MLELSTYSTELTLPIVDSLSSSASNSSMKSSKPRVTVVIPTLNEAKNLPHVLPKLPDFVDEVILVDGRSTDNTVEVARQLRPDIRVVMEKRKGKGIALRSGFEAATGDIIVMIDADGSTAPEEIADFVQALVNGADFAKGSRFLNGAGTSDMEFYRKAGNWAFVTMVRLLFGGKYTDLCYGYNAFWSRVLPKLDLDVDGFEIETCMNIRALTTELKITEVPSFEYDRIHGTSNLQTIPDGWRVLKTILREYRKHLGERLSRFRRKTETPSTKLPDPNLDMALQIILNEALYLLLHSSKTMSPEACQSTLGALRDSFESLVHRTAGHSVNISDFDRVVAQAQQRYQVRFSFEISAESSQQHQYYSQSAD